MIIGLCDKKHRLALEFLIRVFLHQVFQPCDRRLVGAGAEVKLSDLKNVFGQDGLAFLFFDSGIV